MPELGAAQTRLSELAQRLVGLGWNVDVLTALPNYPTGKIFPGYDPRKAIAEEINGVRVVRVPLYVTKGGFTRRIRSYFSFARSARRNGPKFCDSPDILYVESPPLFIAYAAWPLARRWRCPYVLNVSDLWPESAVRMGVVKRGFLTQMATTLERRLYSRSVGVTGTSDDILAGVRRLSPDTPTELITNGVELARFEPNAHRERARELLGAEPGPVFIFAGLLGLAQGLDGILDLAKQLPADAPGRFVLVGDGPMREHVERRIAAESIGRVRLLPSQPRELVPQLLLAADAAIITMGMTIPGMIPNKIYEAMAAGLPILMSADGEAAQRVAEAGAGLVTPPGDVVGLRENFVRLARDGTLRTDLGTAGRRAVETYYDRRVIAERLHRFLIECLTPA